MNSVVTLLVLALFGSVLAGPINVGRRSQCAQKCTESNKFSYQPGTVYDYRYDGAVTTKLHGISTGSSGLQMSARAHIAFITKCEVTLKLSDVQLHEIDPSTGRKSLSPGTDSFRHSLEQHTLSFSFQDGVIDSICSAEPEEEWVTNVKRGILSAFQNSMLDLNNDYTVEEFDVTGKCAAVYRIKSSNWRRSFTVTKTKNLMSCVNRDGFRTALQATPYRAASHIQSLPLLKSTHNCEQTIHNNGYLLKTVCREKHVFRPFSRGDNGAMTETSQMLEFIGERTEIQRPSNRPTKRSDLLFRNDDVNQRKDIRAATAVLEEICQQTTEEVRPETPKLFSDLVYQLKGLDFSTITTLHNKVAADGVCRVNHEAGKKFFHDALSMTGTSASVKLMSDLLKRRHVTGADADMWLSTLAFVQKPTREMVVAVKPLIENSHATRTSYLSVSALVNNYCRHNKDCAADSAVRQISSTLERNLNNNCRVRNDGDKERVLMSLKALGNIGNSKDTVPTLTRCMSERTNSVEIRLAAADALRRQPCDTNRGVAMGLFSDVNEDVEVRIAAYQAIMECANRETFEQVQQVLEREEVNQVGSFVWTHLTNLMETSDPHKQSIRRILENQTLKKQFDLDKRKFSRNLEGSVFFDSVNMGAKAESNIIWSPKSFVPRSAMLNLTVDLFGQSVNLMEVGGRVEGMEQLLENFFGPKGYFPDNSISRSLRRSQRSFNENLMSEKESQYRAARGSSEMKGSVYFKVFGNEITYAELADIMKTEGINILDVLIKLAQEHEYDYTKSLMFLDTTITVPTVLGLPLKLAVNGTATVNLKLSGKMDLRQIATAPRGMEIDGSIKPSSAVEISSVMGVDAFVTKSGLKMVTTLHSSTELNGKISLQNGQIFLANLNMPRDKMEVMSMSNKLYLIHQNTNVPMTSRVGTPFSKRMCTGDKLATITGVEFCGEVEYVNTFGIGETPLFPFNGNTKASLVMNKKDTHTSYTMEARMEKRKSRNNGRPETSYISRLAFNTPNSRVNREISVDMRLRPSERHLSFNLISPWKTANLNGIIQNDPALKKAELLLTVDNNDRYGITSQVTIGRKMGRLTFSPRAELHMAGSEPVVLAGSVDFTEGRKLDVDLTLTNAVQSPLTLKGSVDKDSRGGQRTRYNTDVELKTPWLNSKVKGYVENKFGTYKSRMAFDYQLMSSPVTHQLVANYKVRNTRSVTMKAMSVNLGLRSTQYPAYDFQATWEAQQAARHLETSLKVNYGDSRTDQHLVDTGIVMSYGMQPTGEMKVGGSAKFVSSQLGITSDVKLEHRHSSRNLNSKLNVNLSPSKVVTAEVNLQDLSSALLHYAGDATLIVPGHSYTVSLQLEERQRYEYHQNVFVQWGVGKQAQATAVLKKNVDDYSLKFTGKLKNYPPLSVNLNTRLNPWNFRTVLDLSYNRRKYSANVDYSLNLEGAQIGFAGNVDLICHARHVIAQVRMNRLGPEVRLELNTKWDADRDANKQLAFASFYRITKDRRSRMHAGSVNINFMGSAHEMTLNTKKSDEEYSSNLDIKSGSRFVSMKTSLEYTNGISGKMNVRSSCTKVPELNVEFAHTGLAQSFKTKAEARWAEKRMGMSVISRIRSINDVDVRVQIKTPFTDKRELSAHLKHHVAQSALHCGLSVNIDNEAYTALMTGSVKPQQFDAKIKLVTPFSEHPALGSLHYDFTEPNVAMKINMELAGEQAAASLKLRPQWQNFDAKLEIITPLPGFRKLGVEVGNVISAEEFSAIANLEFNDRKAGFDLIGRMKNQFRNAEATAKISIPIIGYHDLGLTLKYDMGSRNILVETALAWSKERRYGFTLNTDHSQNGKCSGKVVLEWPQLKFNHYTWTHERNEVGIRSAHTVNFDGQDYKLILNGENSQTPNGHHYESDVVMKTPLDWANVNMKNSMYVRRNKLELKSTLARSQRTLYNVDVNVNGYITQGVAVDVNIDSSIIMPVKVVFTMQTNQSPYNARAEIRYNNKAITSELMIKHASLRDFQYTIKMTSPCRYVRNAQIRITSVIQNGRINTAMEVTHNGETYELYLAGENQNTDRETNLSGTLTMKMPNKEPISFTARHSDDSRQFTSSIEANYEGRKQGGAEFNMFHHLQGYRLQNRGSISLTTPFEAYNSMAYRWHHNNNDLQFISKHNGVLNDKSVTFDVDSNIQRVRGTIMMKTKLTIELPIQMVERTELVLNHEHSHNHISTELNVKKSQITLLDMMMTGSKNAANLRGGLRAFIYNMRPVSVATEITRNAPYTVHMETSWNDDQQMTIDLRSSNLDISNVDFTMNVATPFRGFERISAVMRQTYRNGQFRHNSNLEYRPRTRVNVEAIWESYPSTRRTLSITSPCRYFNNLLISSDANTARLEFSGTENMKAEVKTVPGEFTFKATSTLEYLRNLEAIARLRNGEMLIKIQRNPSELVEVHGRLSENSVLSIRTPSRYLHELHASVTPNSIAINLDAYRSGRLLINTPVLNSNRVMMNMEANLDGQQIAKGEVTMMRTTETFNLHVETTQPFYMKQTVEVDITRGFKMNINSNCPCGTYTANAEFTRYSGQARVKINSRRGKTMNGELEIDLNNPTMRLSVDSNIGDIRQITADFTNGRLNAKYVGNHEMEIRGELNELSPSRVSGQFIMTSTIFGLKRVESTVELRHDNYQNGNMEMKINLPVMVVSVSGQYSVPERRAILSIDTPVTAAQTVSVSVTGNTLTLVHNDKTVTFTGHLQSFTTENVQGSLKMTSPFEMLADVELSVYVRHQNYITGQSEITLRNGQYRSTFNTNYAIPDRELNVGLSTPFDMLKSLSIKVQRDSVTMNIVGYERATLDARILAFRLDEMSIKTELTTSLDVLRKLSWSTNFRHENMIRGSGEVVMDFNSRITRAVASYDLTTMDNTLKIVSPSRLFRRMEARLGERSIILDFEGSESLKVVAQLENLSFSGIKANVKVYSTIPQINNGEFIAEASHSRFMRGSARLHMKNNADTASFTALYDLSKMEASTNIHSSFEPLRRVSLIASANKIDLRLNENDQITVTADVESFSLTRTKVRAAIQTTIDGYENFEAVFDSTWLDGNLNQRLHIGTTSARGLTISNVLNTNEARNWIFTVRTPFVGMKAFEIEVNARAAEFRMMVDSNGEVFNSNAAIENLGLFASNGRLSINTPFDLFRQVTVRIGHSAHSEQLVAKASLKVNEVEKKLNMVVDRQHRTLVIETPFNGLQLFRAVLNPTPTNTKLILQIKSDIVPTELEGTIETPGPWIWANLRARLVGRLPFSGLENIDISHTHEFDHTESRFSAKYESRLPVGLTTVKVNAKIQKPFLLELDVRTPHQPLKVLRFKFEHDGEVSAFNNKIDFAYVAYIVRVKFSNELTVNGFDRVMAATRITTPILYFEMINLDLNHKKADGHYITNLDMEYEPREFIRFRSRIQDDAVTMSITSPLPSVNNVRLSLNKNRNGRNNELSASFNYNDLTVMNTKLNMIHILEGLSLTANLQTHLVRSGRYSMEMHHSMDPWNMRELLMVKYGDKQIKASFKARMGEEATTEVLIETPFDYVNKYHSTTMLKRTDELVQYNDASLYEGLGTTVRVNTDVQFKRSADLIDAKFSFEKDSRRYEALFKNVISQRRSRTRMEIKTPESAMNLNNILNINPDQETMSNDFALDSTFCHYRKLSVKITHTGFDLLFKNRVNAELSSSKYGDVRYEQRIDTENFPNLISYAELVTPCPLVSRLRAAASYKVTDRHSFTLASSLNDKEASLVGTCNLNDGINVELNLKTPIECCREMKFNFEVSGNRNEFQMQSVVGHTLLNTPIKMSVTHSHGESLNTRFQLSSQYHEPIAIELLHKTHGQSKKTAQLSVTLGGNKASLTGDVDFLSLKKFHGQLAYQTMAQKRYEISFNHQTTNHESMTNIKLEEDEAMIGKLDVNLLNHGDTLSAEIEVKSPYITPSRASVSVRQRVSGYDINLSGLYGDKQISLKGAYQFTSLRAFNVELELAEPVKYSTKFAYRHAGDLSKMNCELTVDSQLLQFTPVTTKLTWNTKPMTAKLNIEGASFEPITGEVSYNRMNGDMDADLRLTTGSETLLEVSQDSKLERSGFSGESSIRVPRLGVDAAASLEHRFDGNRRADSVSVRVANYGLFGLKVATQRSKTNVEIRIPNKGRFIANLNRENGDATFQLLKGTDDELVFLKLESQSQSLTDLNGHVVLRTPFPYLTGKMAIRHTGDLDQFTTAMMAELADHKVEVSVTNKLDAKPLNINTNMKFVSSFSDPVAFRFVMSEGQKTLKASGTYGEKTIETKISLDLKPNEQKVRMDLRTPWKTFDEVSVEIVNSGSVREFCNVITYASRNCGTYKLTTTLGHRQAEVELETPIPGYEKLSVKAECKSTRGVYSAKVEGAKNQEVYGWMYTLNNALNEKSVTTKLNTPVPGFSEITGSVNFKVEGDLYALKVDLGKENLKYSFEGDYLSKRRARGVLTTPQDGYQRLELTLNSDINEREIGLRAIGQIMSEQVLVSATVTRDLKSMSLEVKTPFNNVQIGKLNYRYSGGKLTASGNLDTNEINFVGEIATEPKYRLNLELRTPFQNFEDLSFTATHSDVENILTSTVNAQYAPGKAIELGIALNYADKYDGNLRITCRTPFRKYQFGELTGDYKIGTNEESALKLTAKLDTYVIASEMKLQINPKFKVKLAVRTPFRNFENQMIDIEFKGNQNRFSAELSMNAMGEQGKITVGFTNQDLRRIVVNARVNTSFRKVEYLSLSLTHNGDSQNLRTQMKIMNANRKLCEVNFNFRRSPTVVELKVQAPGILEIDADKNGLILDHKSRINVKLYGQEYQLLSELNVNDPILGSALLTTPHSVISHCHIKIQHEGGLDMNRMRTKLLWLHNQRKMFEFAHQRHNNGGNIHTNIVGNTVSIVHTGKWRDCGTNFEINLVNGLKIVADQKFALEPAEARLAVRVPGKMSVELYHRGMFPNFKSTVNNVYKNRQIKGEVEVSTVKGIKITAAVETPYQHLQNVRLMINHQGNLRNFNSGVMFQWTPYERITGNLKMNIAGQNVQADMSLYTPFSEMLNIQIGHENDVVKTTAKVAYGRQMMEVIVFCDRNANGYVSLKSPFTYLEDVAFKVRKIRISNNNGYQITVQLSPDREIVLDAAANISNTPKIVYLKVNTPFRVIENVIVNGEHDMTNDALKQRLNIVHNSRPLWESTIDASIGGKRMNGEFILKTPRVMKYAFQMVNEEKLKKLELNLDWDSSTRGSNFYLVAQHKDQSVYYRTKRDNEIRITVPTRTMILSQTYEHSRLRTNHIAEIVWNQQRNQKVKVHLGFEDDSRSYRNAYTVFGLIETPIRTMKTAYKHNVSGAKYTGVWQTQWDLQRNPAKMFEIAADHEMQGSSHLVGVTITHPALSKPILVRNEINFNGRDVIYAGKTTVEYSNDPNERIILIGNVNDESNGRRQNISMMVQISHPKSLTSVELATHMANTVSAASSGFKVNYLTSRRQTETLQLFGEIHKLRKTLNIEARTNYKSITMTGNVQTRSNGFDATMNNKYNGRPVTAKISVNTDFPSFALESSYDPNDSTKLFHATGTATRNHIHVQAYRMNNGLRITDGEVNVKLNSSRVLKTVLRWRPEDRREMQDAFHRFMNVLRSRFEVTTNSVSTAIFGELANRFVMMKRVMPDMDPMVAYIENEIESFRQDYERVKMELNGMYMRNEFFAKDIHEKANEIMTFITEQTARLQYRFRAKMAEFRRQLLTCLRCCRRVFDQFSGRLEETIAGFVLKFRPAWQAYAYAAIRQAQIAKMALRHQSELVKEQLEQYKDDWVNYLDNKFDHITYKMEYYVDKMFDIQEKARFYLLSEKQRTYLDKISDRLNNMWEDLKNKAVNFKDVAVRKADDLLDLAQEMSEAKVVEIIGRENAEQLSSMIDGFFREIKRTYEQWNIDEDLQKLVIHTLEKLSDHVRREARSMMKKVLRVGNTGFTVFDPENGHIEADVFLPLDLDTLDTVPRIDVDAWKNELRVIRDRYLPSRGYSMSDLYYKYKPSSDVANWIPPFKAHASVFLGHHFITFDGHHYKFAGTCSYVLAKVFHDHEFSIVANYRQGKIQSYNIISDGREITFNMDPEFNIKLDQGEAEIPLRVGNTTVLREKNMVTVTNKRGIVYECDLNRERCTLHLSGWYFNKVGGLLGTYDNEPFNDFSTPAQQRLSLERFAESWQVGRNCPRSENLMRSDNPSPSTPACQNMFKDSSSPLNRCFGLINPRPYEEACNAMMARTDGDSKRTVCNIANVYVQECRVFGLDMSAPQKCSACVNAVEEDVIASNTPATQSADVVFVVEEKQCNQGIVGKLSNIAMSIKKELRTRGIRDNRFGLVGFGSKSVSSRPHSHTMKSRLFGSAESLRLAVNRLEMEPSTNKNVLEAVKFAANYPFRSGVSKTIILVPCSTCTDSKEHEKLEQFLRSRDITLHVLQSESFQIAVSTPKAANIIGVDDSTAFTTRDSLSVNLVGDHDLFQQIIVPRDTCADLALKTQGSAFNALKMTGARDDKQFINVMARRVADSARPTEHQKCRCASDKDGNAQTICTAAPVAHSRLTLNTPVRTRLLGYRNENPTMQGFVRPIQRPQQVSFQA